MAETGAHSHLGDDDESDRPVKRQEFNFYKARQAAQGRELSRSISELRDSIAFLRKGLAHVVDVHKVFEERTSQHLVELGTALQSECTKREEDIMLLGGRVDSHGVVISEQRSCCEGLKDAAEMGEVLHRRLELKFEEEQTLRDVLFGRAANAREEAQEHFTESLAKEQHLREEQQAVVEDVQEQLVERLAREQRVRAQEQAVVQSCLEDQKRLCQATLEQSECAAASAVRECDKIRARFLHDLHSETSGKQAADKRIEALEEASAALDASVSQRQAWTQDAELRIGALEQAKAALNADASQRRVWAHDADHRIDALEQARAALDEGASHRDHRIDALEKASSVLEADASKREGWAHTVDHRVESLQEANSALHADASQRQAWTHDTDRRLHELEKASVAVDTFPSCLASLREEVQQCLSESFEEGRTVTQRCLEEQRLLHQAVAEQSETEAAAAVRECGEVRAWLLEAIDTEASRRLAWFQTLDQRIHVLEQSSAAPDADVADKGGAREEVLKQLSEDIAREQHLREEQQAVMQDQEHWCRAVAEQSETAAASAFQECSEIREQLLQAVARSHNTDQRIEALEEANAALGADAVRSHERDRRIEVLEEAKAAADADALARQAWSLDTERRIQAVERENADLGAEVKSAVDANAAQRQAWTHDTELRIEALEEANAALDADASLRRSWIRNTDHRIESLEQECHRCEGEQANVQRCLDEQRELCEAAAEHSERVAATSSAGHEQIRGWVQEALGTDASARQLWTQSADERIVALERASAAVDADLSERHTWSQRAERRMDELEEALERANAVGAENAERQACNRKAEHRVGELEEEQCRRSTKERVKEKARGRSQGGEPKRRAKEKCTGEVRGKSAGEKAREKAKERRPAQGSRGCASEKCNGEQRSAEEECRGENQGDEEPRRGAKALERSNTTLDADASERLAWSQKADHRIDELAEALKRTNTTMDTDASERLARSEKADHRIDELEEALGRATTAMDSGASERLAWSRKADHRIHELEEALEKANAAIDSDASQRRAWIHRLENRIEEFEEALQEQALSQRQAVCRLDGKALADSEKSAELRKELVEERSSLRLQISEHFERELDQRFHEARVDLESQLKVQDSQLEERWEVFRQSVPRLSEEFSASQDALEKAQELSRSVLLGNKQLVERFEEERGRLAAALQVQQSFEAESREQRFEEQREQLATTLSGNHPLDPPSAEEGAVRNLGELGEEASRQASELSSVSRKLGMFESELRAHEDVVAQRLRDTQAQIRRDLEAGCRPLEEAVTSLRKEFEEQVLQHSRDELSQVISGKKGCILEGLLHDGGLEAAQAPLPASALRLGDLSQIRAEAEESKLRTPRPPTWRGCTAPPAPLVPAPPVPVLPMPAPVPVLPVLAPLVQVLPEPRVSARTPRVV